MERIVMDILLVLFFTSVISPIGARVPMSFEVVPQGLESVNGSDINMGCIYPLGDMGGFKCCDNPNGPSVSHLSNGKSPEINPYKSDWAAGLMTVRKNAANVDIPYPHVVMTFGFSSSINPTAIDLDLFLCPAWNISAPFITVFGSTDFLFRSQSSSNDFISMYRPSQTSCDCLSTVRVPFQKGEPSYPIWHIVVSFDLQMSVKWVHVGEVKFLNTSTDPLPATYICGTPTPPLPDQSSSPAPSPTTTSLSSTPSMTTMVSKNSMTPHVSLNLTSSEAPLPSITAVSSAPQTSTTATETMLVSSTATTISETMLVSLGLSSSRAPSHSTAVFSASQTYTTATKMSETILVGSGSSQAPFPSSTAVRSASMSSFQTSTTATKVSETMLAGSGLSSGAPSPNSITVSSGSLQTSTIAPMVLSSSTTMIVGSSQRRYQTPSPSTTPTFITSMVQNKSMTILVASYTSSNEAPLSGTKTVSSSSTSNHTQASITASLVSKDSTRMSFSSNSTKSVSIPTGKNKNPVENNGISVLLIASVAGIGGLVLLTLICVIMVGFSLRRCNHSKKKQLNALHNRKTLSNDENFIINPVYLPLYSVIGKGSIGGNPMIFNLYKDIDADTLTTQVGLAIDEGGSDEGTVASTLSTNVSIDIESQQPHTNDECSPPTLDVKDATESEHMCSEVQVSAASVPVVALKSSDLSQDLASHSTFNVGIYSEPINPSDFNPADSQASADGEDDPLICAPIYPLPTVPLEDISQPREITSDNFEEINEIGGGLFGKVVLATTNQQQGESDYQDMPSLVAVKKLKPHPSQKQQEAFNSEIKFMFQLKHPNVLRLLGVCYQNPAFIVMEYTEEGDLNQFLQKYAEIVTTPSYDTQIATSTVVHMASQIANGMKHLATLNFIHRDIATQNCLIGKNFIVKIADRGVNTQLYQQQYYRIKGNMMLPIRWMAKECFSGKFSEKSDVWAFGITMWELFTLAKNVPYPHLSDEEVIHNALKREYRLFPSRPEACPLPVYEIMKQCWIIDLQQRAIFQGVNVMLQMCI